MDNAQRSYYGLQFEITFLRKKGKEFETFFASVMAHGFLGDFSPVRPYGSDGDLKCDGHRSSDGTVFQCYAPETLNQAVLLKKIEEDFNGARDHWGSKMRRWAFVYNITGGLPAKSVRLIDDLRSAHPSIEIENFGEACLRDVVMGLKIHQLEDLFGQVPRNDTMKQLSFENLQKVLKSIQERDPGAEPPLIAPSSTKLEHNALSKAAADMLRLGRQREKLVQDFFDEWPNPSFGEEIAEAFRSHYESLKAVSLSPDQIFGELQSFTGGMEGNPTHQAAVLAVLSYFFERCDIFEDAVQGEVK